MKFRAQFRLMSALILSMMLGVFVTEVGLWVLYQKQVERRNYVIRCLQDVFEFNLLTYELNFFQDTSRPIDQIEAKLQVLTEKIQGGVLADVVDDGQRQALKSTLQSIQSLLGHIRKNRERVKLSKNNVYEQEFAARAGVQLLQRSRTLYSEFSLMRLRLVEQEARAGVLFGMVRALTLAFLFTVLIISLFLLQRRFARSLTLLESGADEVARGRLDFSFPLRSTGRGDEIDVVKGAFNGMLSSLKKASGEIQKKNQELETLLYVISHDLKEPLRAIEYFSTAVRERHAQALEPEAQDYLCRCAQGAVRMRLLLDDILALSRARRVVVPSHLTPVGESVHKALERLARQIQETGAKVRVAPSFPPLRVDPTWIQEVVYNLVSNALKYVRPNERPEIEILPFEVDGPDPTEAGIVVLDRGPGVPSDMSERIFALFQRGVGRQIEGTGAGLAIVRAVAEQHGGRAWVEPREGGGSQFFVTFKG